MAAVSTGICARRSPTTGYETYEFSVPLGEHGDVYDRYLIRLQEFRESMKILNQAVARLERVKGPYPLGESQVLPAPAQ